MPSLASIDPYAYRWLLERDLIQLNNGYLRFEVAQARKIIEHQPELSLWDLKLHADKQIFVGFWEEVEDQSLHYFDFHPECYLHGYQKLTAKKHNACAKRNAQSIDKRSEIHRIPSSAQ